MTASLLIVAPAAISAVPAVAADDDPTVDVAIDSFLPAVPKPGDAVTIKGTVTNTSTATFENPQAITCIDRDRLATAADLAAVPDEQNVPMRERSTCTRITAEQAFQEFDGKLAPKAKVPFTLTIPWSEWEISNKTGAYTVGVTFRGDPDGQARRTAGRARTFLPVIGTEPPARQVNTALVIPLRHRPTQLGGQRFANESLAQAMGPGGELRRLLDLGKNRRVTWLLDPSLVDEAEQMAKGYVVGENKSAPAGTGGKIAQAWLNALNDSQAKGNQIVLLPYGDPDVAGLVDSGAPLREILREARTISEQANIARGATNGLWLEGGAAASRYLAFATSGFRGSRPNEELNLINSAAWATEARTALVPGTSVYQVLTPEGPARQSRAVVADSALTAAGPDVGTTNNPVQVRQRLIAETALLAASGSGPASTVLLPARAWDATPQAIGALIAGLTQPWINPVTVDQVVKATAKTPVIKAPTAPRRNALLPEAQLDAAAAVDKTLTTFEGLLDEPEAVQEPLQKSLLRVASLSWLGYPDEAKRFGQIEFGSVRKQVDAVHLVNTAVDSGRAKEIKVNLAGSNGTFPLTIANDLDHPVWVGVQVTSANRSDLRINAVKPVLLGAGKKWTPRITASAEQNGVIRAYAQVVTRDQQPVGKRQELLIQATQYGSVGWVLVGAACALLFGTSFVRIYRRIRAERKNPPSVEAEAPTDDPLHPAPLPAAPATPDANAGTPVDASLKEGVGSKDG
ncbi:hypothetical protein GCM10009534_06400 [Kribbella sandramycini]